MDATPGLSSVGGIFDSEDDLFQSVLRDHLTSTISLLASEPGSTPPEDVPAADSSAHRRQLPSFAGALSPQRKRRSPSPLFLSPEFQRNCRRRTPPACRPSSALCSSLKPLPQTTPSRSARTTPQHGRPHLPGTPRVGSARNTPTRCRRSPGGSPMSLCSTPGGLVRSRTPCVSNQTPLLRSIRNSMTLVRPGDDPSSTILTSVRAAIKPLQSSQVALTKENIARPCSTPTADRGLKLISATPVVSASSSSRCAVLAVGNTVVRDSPYLLPPPPPPPHVVSSADNDDEDDLPCTQSAYGLILDGVVVFVDVRTMGENWSKPVRDHLHAMGAKTTERINKTTTHVVFKDGTRATFDQTRARRLFLVSVLWVEACRKQRERVPEQHYLPQAIEHLESPVVSPIRRRRYRRPKPPAVTPIPEEPVQQPPAPVVRAPTRNLVEQLLMPKNGCPYESDSDSDQLGTPLAARLFKRFFPNGKSDANCASTESSKPTESTPSADVTCNSGTGPRGDPCGTPPPALQEDNSDVAGSPVLRRRVIGFTSRQRKSVEKKDSHRSTVTSGATYKQCDAVDTPLLSSTRRSSLETRSRAKPLFSNSESSVDATGLESVARAEEAVSPHVAVKLIQSKRKTPRKQVTKPVSKAHTSGEAVMPPIIEKASAVDSLIRSDDETSSQCSFVSKGRAVVVLSPLILETSVLTNSEVRDVSCDVVGASNVRKSPRKRARKGPEIFTEAFSVAPIETNTSAIADLVSSNDSVSATLDREGDSSRKRTKKSILTSRAKQSVIPSIEKPAKKRTTKSVTSHIVGKQTVGTNETAATNDVSMTSSEKYPTSRKVGHPLGNMADVSATRHVEGTMTTPAEEDPFSAASADDFADRTNGSTRKRTSSWDLDGDDPVDSGDPPLARDVGRGRRRRLLQLGTDDVAPQTLQQAVTPAAAARAARRPVSVHPALRPAPPTLSGAYQPRGAKMDKPPGRSSKPAKQPKPAKSDRPPPAKRSRKDKTQKPCHRSPPIRRFSPCLRRPARRSSLDFTSLAAPSVVATPPVLVVTNQTSADRRTLLPIISQLGTISVVDKVDSDTTHVVSGLPRRTLSVLRALAVGCWLLSPDWIYASLEAGQWLPEEQFELTADWPAAHPRRLIRRPPSLATPPAESSVAPPLFKTCGSVFISGLTRPPRREVAALLRLCGATLASAARGAAIAVGRPCRCATIVSELWVLDSVHHGKLQPLKKYVVGS